MKPLEYYQDVKTIVEEERRFGRPPLGVKNERFHSFHLDQQRAILWLLRPYFPLNRILDVGCGPIELWDHFDPICVKELIGLDIVAYESWRSSPNRHCIVSDVDKDGLPFQSRSFNAVIMSATLEHLFDPFNAIEESSRVLVEGGLFVVVVPNIAYFKQRVRLLLGRIPITSTAEAWTRRSWDGYHLHYFNLERLKWLVNRYGKMQVIRVIGSGKYATIRSIWPAALTGDLIMLARKM